MTPKLVDVDKKKEKIIGATLQALAEKGLSELRIVDISNKLDMGKSTIYEYFNTKDELIKQALEYFLQEHYIPAKNEDYTFMEEIKSIFYKFKEHSEEELEQFNVVIDIFYHGIKGDFTTMEDVFKDYIDYMIKKIEKDQKAGIIRKDIDSEAVASWVGSTIDGIGFQLMLKDDYNLEQVITSFIEALESYLKVK